MSEPGAGIGPHTGGADADRAGAGADAGRVVRGRRAVAEVLRDTRRRLTGHDLPVVTAGATLYGAIAAVPSMLVAIGLATLVLGRDEVLRRGLDLASVLPDQQGAARWVGELVRAGVSLSPPGVVFAAVMASAYARGLQLALRRFAPVREDLPPTWWTRVQALPVLALAPLLLGVLLVAAPTLSRLSADPSLSGIAGASYLSLNLVWVITWLPFTWAFRVVAPGRPAWRAAVVGALVTGAFISGFLQGFVLFLAVPVDLGRPFGGLTEVGVISGALLFLWVMHMVVCTGYALTWAVDARLSGDA